MRDFGVELHRVKFARFVRHTRNRASVGLSHEAKSIGQFGHRITVAHPYIEQTMSVGIGLVLDIIKQCRMPTRTDFRKAEFAWFTECFRSLNLAAELLGHRLHTVANAEHRHAEFKHNLRCAWCIALGDRVRSAREDDAFRAVVRYKLRRDIVGINFGEHPRIAHAAGDELGDLGAEIDDEDFIVVIGHSGCAVKK